MTQRLSLAALIAVSLCGCFKSYATAAEIVGTWKNPDGAEFKFEDGGRFSARRVVATWIDFTMGKDVRVDGRGTWQLQEGNRGTEVSLDFDELGDTKNGLETKVFVRGSGDSLRLFFEDGEQIETYEFAKDR